jgi:hypothetical protein
MGSNSRGERLTIYSSQTDPLISHERGKRFLLMLLSIGSSDWVYNTRLDWFPSYIIGYLARVAPKCVTIGEGIINLSGTSQLTPDF